MRYYSIAAEPWWSFGDEHTQQMPYGRGIQPKPSGLPSRAWLAVCKLGLEQPSPDRGTLFLKPNAGTAIGLECRIAPESDTIIR